MANTYKSAREIRHSLEGLEHLALFSCGGCANMNAIGGVTGLRFVRQQLEQWGKEVITAQVVTGCCCEAVMRHAVRAYLRPVASRIEALVQISCAAGIKDAFHCNPGLPVIAACDPIGVEALLPHGASFDDPAEALIADGLCTPRGHCVLSFTHGICPYTACPSKSLYGPCTEAPPQDGACARNPRQRCVWKVIEARGVDYAALERLKAIHADEHLARLPSFKDRASPVFMQRLGGALMARLPNPLVECVHWIR